MRGVEESLEAVGGVVAPDPAAVHSMLQTQHRRTRLPAVADDQQAVARAGREDKRDVRVGSEAAEAKLREIKAG